MNIDIYGITNENILKHYYEPEVGLFIAESPIVIERALNAGYIAESFLIEEHFLSEKENELLKMCPDAEVFIVDEQVKKDITGYPMTRGMLAAMRRKSLPDIREICEDKRRIVILENVMNPSNMGAIFRSAAALGMDGILLTPGCTDPFYRRAARVSMGTVFQIPWTYMDNTNVTWIDVHGELLHQMGYKLVSMALRDDTVNIDDPSLRASEKLAIILGTEGQGLDEYTIHHSDMTVKIPMYHGVDSLNVAAASAVAFWELAR